LHTIAPTTNHADPWPDPKRLKPRVLVIGAQKSGTTSVFKYLKPHPAFKPPTQKELDYFTLHHNQGNDWYAAQFPRTPRFRKHAATLEASTSYLIAPEAPARARALLPHATITVILRDPVARAHSHFKHNTCLLYTSPSPRDRTRSRMPSSA